MAEDADMSRQRVVLTEFKLQLINSNGVVSFSVTYTLEGEIGVEKQIFARYEDAQGLEKKTEESK